MTQPFTVTRVGLLVATLVGLAAACGTLLFPVDAPVGGAFPNTLSVALRAPQGGKVGIAWEFGAGSTGTHSIALAPSGDFTRVALPMPAGTIVRLQLILPAGAAAKDALIVNAEGRVLRRFATELLPDGTFALRTNLHLPTDPRRRGPAVSRERVAAGCLAAAEVALLAALWRRREPIPVPSWLARAAIGLACAAVLFSRRPSVLVSPQFWCEDGTIYFLGRAAGWHGLWETQANYLALLPRATAALASLAPVLCAPAVYAAVAIAVSLVAAVKAASPRVGLPFPAFAALAVVLVPNMDEITANVTNAQWFGAAILVLVCLSRPPDNFCQAARDAVALVVFGLTGPFILFVLPLLLWRAVRTRSTAAWLLLALGTAVALLQCWAYLSSQSGPQQREMPPFPKEMPPVTPFLAAAGFRTGGQLFGLMRPPLLANPIPWGIAGLVLYGLMWFCFRLRAAAGEIRPLLAWMALAVILGGFMRFLGYANLFFEQVFIARYFYLPLLFAAWLFLGGLATPGPRRWLAGVGLSAAVACNLPYYRMAPYTDLQWPHYASAIERGERIQVPINPPNWNFVSPAGR
jgi:hypothetical protein